MFNLVVFVAVQAKAHFCGRFTAYNIHRLNRPMTLLTFKSEGDVTLVSEMHEVRQVVNFYPGDGFFRIPVVSEQFNLRSIGRNLCMATHAFVDAWNAR